MKISNGPQTTLLEDINDARWCPFLLAVRHDLFGINVHHGYQKSDADANIRDAL